MPAQLTTRAQVNGYRFLLRRLDHALVRRDVRMLHDPMRSQSRSLLVGAVLGVLAVAGCAILAFLRPQGSIGDAHIVMGKESGALYVVVPDGNGGDPDKSKVTLHPVLNLASARLITGSAESPKSVKDSRLGSLPRGPMLGIPGAPAALPGSGQGAHSAWTLCDSVSLSPTGSAAGATGATMTVLAGRPRLDDRIRATNPDEALLVRRGDKTYLIYDGKRALVDPRNTVMSRSVDLSVRPRPVTTGLLDATREVAPLAPPQIPRAGERGPGKLAGVPVGGVVSVGSVTDPGRPNLYVVLSDGVQPVTSFAAQVIRNADSHGMSEIQRITPDLLDGIPVVNALPVDQFPERTPKILSAEDAPVACVSWAASAAGDGPASRAMISLLAGNRLPLPDTAKPVTMSGAGTPDHVDAVYVPPTTGEFIQVTGIEPDSPRRDGLFYVADNGIRYGIPDRVTAAQLGLEKTPRLAPWAIVGQLIPGPTLSRADALVSHDTLPQAG